MEVDIPNWLFLLAIASLSVAGLCSLIIGIDLIAGHRQHMWIMNIVWPVTALYFGPLALCAYFKWGRLSTKTAVVQAKQRGEQNPGMQKPFWQKCALGGNALWCRLHIGRYHR